MKTLIAPFALLALSSTGLALTGCAGDDHTLDAEASEMIARPSVAVTANGVGCPGRRFSGSLGADGVTITIVPEGSDDPLLDALVTPGAAFAAVDCTLGIDVRDPQNRSFRVESFELRGTTVLSREGMRARRTAKFAFQGNPVPAPELASDTSGPFDGPVVFADAIAASEDLWSPCTTRRRINGTIRAIAENDPGKRGLGSALLSSTLTLKLAWRTC